MPGKGLGVIALRDIPPFTRVMVDRGYTFDEAKNDPRFVDLHPKDDTGLDKFMLNSAGLGEEFPGKVAYRISRVNHSCDPNTFFYVDDLHKASMLVSVKPIKVGEEICATSDILFNYKPRFGPTHPKDRLEYHWRTLRYFRNISCPSDCVCLDPSLPDQILKFNQLKDLALVSLAREEFELSYKAFNELKDFCSGKSVMGATRLKYEVNQKHAHAAFKCGHKVG